MPFPYVSPDELERELALSQDDTGLTETEWSELLTDKLEQESERVEAYAGEQWRDAAEADVPRVIEGATIRLTRSVLHQIEEDGLSSENVGDHSESYRAPAAIRAEVRAELADAGYGGETSGLTRNTDRTITVTPGSESGTESSGTTETTPNG